MPEETTLERKVREIIELARNSKLKSGRNKLRPGQSSLHDIIRTKEQAERFRKLMKMASDND
jgi:hypothetical protein